MWTQQDSFKKKIKKTIENFEFEHDIHLKNIVALKKKVKKLDEACAWTWVQVPYKGHMIVSTCLLLYSFSRTP